MASSRSGGAVLPGRPASFVTLPRHVVRSLDPFELGVYVKIGSDAAWGAYSPCKGVDLQRGEVLLPLSRMKALSGLVDGDRAKRLAGNEIGTLMGAP